MEMLLRAHFDQNPSISPDAHILQMPSSCHALVKVSIPSAICEKYCTKTYFTAPKWTATWEEQGSNV